MIRFPPNTSQEKTFIHHLSSWPTCLFIFTGYSPLEFMTNVTYSFCRLLTTGIHDRHYLTQVCPSCLWDFLNIYQRYVLPSLCNQDTCTSFGFAFVQPQGNHAWGALSLYSSDGSAKYVSGRSPIMLFLDPVALDTLQRFSPMAPHATSFPVALWSSPFWWQLSLHSEILLRSLVLKLCLLH